MTARGKYADATWCARAVAWAGGSPVRAQKQLIAAADAAASAGEIAAAREIYELLLREHPETSFADFVGGRLARLSKGEQ